MADNQPDLAGLDQLAFQFVTSLARHALSIGAGYLGQKGILAGNDGEMLVALGLAALAVGWSYLSKKLTAKTVTNLSVANTDLAANTTTTTPKQP